MSRWGQADWKSWTPTMAASIKEEEELWSKGKNFGHNQLLLVGGQNFLRSLNLENWTQDWKHSVKKVALKSGLKIDGSSWWWGGGKKERKEDCWRRRREEEKSFKHRTLEWMVTHEWTFFPSNFLSLLERKNTMMTERKNTLMTERNTWMREKERGGRFDEGRKFPLIRHFSSGMRIDSWLPVKERGKRTRESRLFHWKTFSLLSSGGEERSCERKGGKKVNDTLEEHVVFSHEILRRRRKREKEKKEEEVRRVKEMSEEILNKKQSTVFFLVDFLLLNTLQNFLERERKKLRKKLERKKLRERKGGVGKKWKVASEKEADTNYSSILSLTHPLTHSLERERENNLSPLSLTFKKNFPSFLWMRRRERLEKEEERDKRKKRERKTSGKKSWRRECLQSGYQV